MSKDTETTGLEGRWVLAGPAPKWWTMEAADHVDRIVASAPELSPVQKYTLARIMGGAK